MRLSLCQRGEKKLSRDAARWGGEGAIVMLPHCVRELPYAPFWGFNAAHRCPALFLLCGTAFAQARRREGGVGSYSNAPSRCSGASICSFLGTQCSAPLPGTVSFMRDCFRASAAQSRVKETPPLIAGVRCIGRSYRNRTYTMGVRGPCATTTPSSNARMIIAHYFAFCNRFCQQY